MIDQDRRNSGRLGVAILVAGFVIAAAIFASSYLRTSRTVTETTATTTLTGTNGTSRLYRVEFLQGSNCYYGSWRVPWAVELDNQSVVQPSNATLPLSYANTHFTSSGNYSAIWFSSEWNVQLHDTPEEYLWAGTIWQRDNQWQRRGNPSVLVCHTVRVSHYHWQRIDGFETSRAKIYRIRTPQVLFHRA